MLIWVSGNMEKIPTIKLRCVYDSITIKIVKTNVYKVHIVFLLQTIAEGEPLSKAF